MLALAFSFLFTGLGQIYNGELAKGLLFVAIQLINFALIYWFVGLITAPAFWIYSLLDAVDTAERLRAERQRALDGGGTSPKVGPGPPGNKRSW
jgi:TM2 domain-containing membrane protein YozV